MEIIVLKTTNYKEKDAIVEGLDENGSHSFLVKGLQSPKCANIVLANKLIDVDIELQEGKYKHPIIKKSKTIASPYHMDDDLYTLASINLIDEITINLLQEDERTPLYTSLKEAIKVFQNKKADPLSISLIYFMKVLKESGYSFEANHCVRCDKKKGIATFSFSEGGFICKDCLTDDIELKLSKEAMISIRKAIIATEYKTIEELSFPVYKELIKELKVFVLDYLGVKLTSVDLFL